jgi:DNA-binding PadR family transcriptional regulator
MSVALVILGFLREREYHGYELKKEIQRRMGVWTDIKFGSIYHALRKLVERGSVARVGEEKQSGRPDRTIYRITEQGREEFQDRLQMLLNRFQRVYLDFDIGLYFGGNLPPHELEAVLDKRIDHLTEIVAALESYRELPFEENGQSPEVSRLIIDHGIFHIDTEIRWLQYVKERLQQGAFSK